MDANKNLTQGCQGAKRRRNSREKAQKAQKGGDGLTADERGFTQIRVGHVECSANHRMSGSSSLPFGEVDAAAGQVEGDAGDGWVAGVFGGVGVEQPTGQAVWGIENEGGFDGDGKA